ncbi:S-layer homology domain-containing protein [Butyricicoccus sp. OF27-2pH9A]|uniref:S-layer homology domain-containing protein n=1 Tax=Butyricicoccus sp. OF27-2pH9A TaxID=3002517 RepID=UPI0022DF7659|nr:S-layer homology domain-containing protein [Butyricicoccus sp. OF27-2pH9A]
MKRRLLSAFLAVMMVLTMAPVAFAADGSEVSSTVEVSTATDLQSALTEATDGTVIKLTDNITVSSRAKFSGQSMTVTLDLNNYTLTGSDSDYALSNENGNGATTGKLIVKNGTIKRADDVKGSNSTVRNYGQMELNNVQVQGNYIVVKNEETATLIMNDCTLTAPDVYGNNQAPSGLQNWGTATANNCSIKSGTAVMAASWADSKQSYDSNTSLNDCTISGSSYAVSSGRADKSTAKQIVTVNGGSYTGNINSGAGSDITINAEIKGKMRVVNDFSYNLGSASYITSGPSKVTLAEGGSVSGTINAAAKNGNTYYSTVTNAVEEATNGNTIELVQDTTEDVVIPADKTITLDLNGKKLTNVQSDTITVTKGATLTVQGKGIVDNVTNAKAPVYNNGITTLNGGKYTRSAEAANTTSSSGGNSYYNILNHGVMTINEGVEVYSSGHFSSLVANGYYNYSDTQKGDRTAYIEGVGHAAPELTINDGKFSGGINTIKNDDNATLTINNGEFSNVTQAVVQNNNIATINGGTFDADGYHALENWKYNSNYNAGNLTVTNGKFAGSIATNAAVSLKISGGLYTENPSKYLADSVKDSYKYAAVKHASPYLFEVKEILDENVEVIPNVGAAEAKSAAGVVNEADVAKVDAAAKVVAAPKISEAAAVVADKVDAKQYTEKATNITKADRVEVRAYLEVTPKEYSADSYKLNITPKYDIVVVGTDNQEQKFTGDTLPVSNETPVSVQLPDGFVTNTDSLYVQHKGHEYNADVSVNTVKVDGVDKNIYTAKFNNPDGFSDFTITKTTQSVAVIGNNKYTTLQNAIDAAQTGATIVLQKDCTEKVTVAGKSLTINRNGKTFDEANVTVGSNCTKEVKNDTIVVTYTKPSSSSSGGSSSGKTTYKVTTSAVNNGGVNASPSNAEKGATITITLSPDKGYKLDKLTVTDGSGKSVSTVKKSDTVYTFTMPASAVKVGVSYVKATETPSETKFNDVSANDWFASAVDYVTGKGMMNGTAANTFSPKANTTRGMLMTVLARHAGEDTTGGSVWYEKGMNWAKANGVSDGTNPQVNITREQLAAMLYRYAQNKKYDVSGAKSLDGYTDAQSVSSYAVPALQWANAAGVVNGKSGSKLDPKGYATRAEVAAMLMRFCENVEK